MNKILLIFCILFLSGCGFSPMYGNHDIQKKLYNIKVLPTTGGDVEQNYNFSRSIISKINNGIQPESSAYNLSSTMNISESTFNTSQISIAEIAVTLSFILHNNFEREPDYKFNLNESCAYSNSGNVYDIYNSKRGAVINCFNLLTDEMLDKLTIFFIKN